ncbi:hypothetical protein GIB67_022980 [Kingdonia uniflora]|uniref:Uncharacterized protein n=1 Tax=Kingdonia uniflora TaxID=39325 RepID=A0A7J7P2G1_9MAGN|nr:hypothetical protein GIB67_022980 [Kingdonia uniflora]
MILHEINTCIGIYCDYFSPNKAYKLKMWTGWFTAFGGTVHRRPEEDLAFSVTRFIQNSGSFINYYMVNLEYREEQGSSHYEISPPINQHCSFAESAEEPNKLIDNKPEPWKTSRTESPLKGLFLSNPSFLSHAEYFLDLNINQPILSQPTTIEDHDTMDTKLIMNCANELMERNGVKVSQWDHPILRTCIPNPRNNISINKLVNKVCEGVDNLISYIEKNHSTKPTDSFKKMLESDLMGKGMMVGGVGFELGEWTVLLKLTKL